MYALHLPLQGIYCLLLSLFTQGAASLALGYYALHLPFRAFIVCYYRYLPKVPLCLPWAMYALHLPLQGIYCLLLSLFTQGAVPLALGYVRSAFAISGHLLLSVMIIAG